jgi:eukaryotic-like serine/threonine-protein kinase
MQNSPARAGIDVGSVIAGTYTIEALIGRGGMGAVFLASHARLPGKKVAIKVLHAEMSGDEILARFKREAQIASLLSHPNIVHIEDYNVTADGMPYLVLEYLQGESLAQRLKAGPLTPEQAFSIIRQVGSALAAAHQKGIVHRDLKPQNIFLVPSEIDGRSFEVAKVLDFGISKMRDSQTVKTQDSALLGTPQYMAPEQATGQHASVDERTDVFALGAIVYEMLAGQPAFSGASIPEVVFKVVYEQPTQLTTQVPTLSLQIATAVHRAMSKPAGDRYSTVSDFLEALTGNPLPAPRSGNSLPPPDVGFATGSRLKDSGKEAFANTVGSGDHSAAVAATVDSGNRANSVVPAADQKAVGNAPTISTNSGPPIALAPTVSPPQRSRAGLFVALGLAVAAAGAIAFSALRNKPSTPVENQQVATRDEAPDPAPDLKPEDKRAPLPIDEPVNATGSAAGSSSADTLGESATASNAGSNADLRTGTNADSKTGTNADSKTGSNADAKTGSKTGTNPDSKTGAKTGSKTGAKTGSTTASATTATADDNDAGGDATAKQKLDSADTALKASDWGRAEQLANSVINSEDANPKQKARAVMIHGMAQCLGRNNEEGALADLRRIKNAPAIRLKLLKVCHQAGFLAAER